MIREIKPEIIAHLNKEKKIASVIDAVHIDYKIPTQIDVFSSLIRSIVSQQLSITAAKTIHDRFLASLDRALSPCEQITSKSLDDLRALGFSYSKAQYVHNVAQFFEDNKLFDVDWERKSDEEILQLLTQIKGVGHWTVEMILMFTLMREDVLPLDDLIIRNHMIVLFDVEEMQKKALYLALEKKAEKWRPYRSIACRYLWAGKGLDMFKV
jgi:DNA-3-methyladenine glycosylase II